MGHQTRAACVNQPAVDSCGQHDGDALASGRGRNILRLVHALWSHLRGPHVPPYHENNILGSRPAFPIAMRSNNGTPGRWNRLAASTHVDVDAHADVEHAGQLVD